MSPIEEKVTGLLAELADARPVEVGTPPVTAPATGAIGRGDRPDYVPVGAAAPRRRRRPVLVAAVVVVVLAVVGGLLVLGRGGGSPVVASLSDLPVDTSLLGDGRMAVVIENQLYVADGPTGQVWKLTATGRGEEVSNVSFSHDGEWVAFTIHDESGLWVSRWDGTERHRIGRAPTTYAWSPTDDQLAYATQNEVRIAQTDGTSRALTVATAPKPFTRVVWSPAGTGVAFVHAGGGTTREALDDTAEPEWSSTYTAPATEVVAWPSAEVLVVVGSSDRGAAELDALLMLSVETRTLIPFDGENLDVEGSTLAAVTPDGRGVSACDLAELACGPLPLPDQNVRWGQPVVSPDGTTVAAIATSGGVLPGSNLVTARIGAQYAEILGHVDGPAPRGTLDVDGVEYGVSPEPPVWAGPFLFARVDERRVERLPSVGTSNWVVAWRFLPPADDYPGGTGLAYWTPR